MEQLTRRLNSVLVAPVAPAAPAAVNPPNTAAVGRAPPAPGVARGGCGAIKQGMEAERPRPAPSSSGRSRVWRATHPMAVWHTQRRWRSGMRATGTYRSNEAVETTGYPLTPGTAPPCSRECWKCGVRTTPLHLPRAAAARAREEVPRGVRNVVGEDGGDAGAGEFCGGSGSARGTGMKGERALQVVWRVFDSGCAERPTRSPGTRPNW